jgi:CheY-like chemotaxis protein
MQRILIVDDHPELRKLVALTLGAGYAIREARDGVEALDQCRDFRPDVVLLDIAMPGSVDGFEVCREIRRDPSIADTKVVMLSAHARTADLAAGRESGADAYLVKPFSPLALMDLVARLTGEPEAVLRWSSPQEMRP